MEDLFDLSCETLGLADVVYDRAALVALPETMRERYTAYLKALRGFAPQLVIGYEYDRTIVPRPPFSVTPIKRPWRAQEEEVPRNGTCRTIE